MTTGSESHLHSSASAAALSLLERLIAISSPSGDLTGLDRMASTLAEECARRGLEPEISRRPDGTGRELPVLLARGPARGGRHLLVIGHMDTVLPAAAPRREGDRLFATGSIDMKGGLAAFLGALDLARARGSAMPGDLLLVVAPDEEVAGPLARQAPMEWGAGARAVWVIEPGEPAGEGETIVAGRRGLFDWRLEVGGRSAHSGLHYWQGRSAIAAAAAWCAAATALSRPDGGPTVNVARFVGGDSGFVGDLASAAALLHTSRQLNVVPDRALVEGEARFLSAGEGEEMVRRLEELTAETALRTGCQLEFHRDTMVPPVDPRGLSSAWCDRAVELAARRGWRLEVERDRGGISFPNFLADPAAQPVLDGLGPVGGGMHTRGEYVSIASLERRVALLADLLQADAESAR
jgi:glutamate carboxypeptidase